MAKTKSLEGGNKAQQPRESALFPAGYGDLVLQSSDNVLLHFARFLLSYGSPTFSQMYEIEKRDQVEALHLEEDCETLECILSQLDPMKDTPTLQWDSAEKVLAAAEKYEIKRVFSWFEKEVTLEVNKTLSLTMEQPLLCLTLATRYNLSQVARMALRQLVKCPLADILHGPPLGEDLMRLLMGLRAKRSEWLITAALSMLPLTPQPCTSERGYGAHKRWVLPEVPAIVSHPSWGVLCLDSVLTRDDLRGSDSECRCKPTKNSVRSWKERAIELENKLPELELPL